MKRLMIAGTTLAVLIVMTCPGPYRPWAAPPDPPWGVPSPSPPWGVPERGMERGERRDLPREGRDQAGHRERRAFEDERRHNDDFSRERAESHERREFENHEDRFRHDPTPR